MRFDKLIKLHKFVIIINKYINKWMNKQYLFISCKDKFVNNITIWYLFHCGNSRAKNFSEFGHMCNVCSVKSYGLIIKTLRAIQRTIWVRVGRNTIDMDTFSCVYRVVCSDLVFEAGNSSSKIRFVILACVLRPETWRSVLRDIII